MEEKQMSVECNECESSFDILYMNEMVSQDMPQYCPFCGEEIEEIQEHYIEEDDDDLDSKEWD